MLQLERSGNERQKACARAPHTEIASDANASAFGARTQARLTQPDQGSQKIENIGSPQARANRSAPAVAHTKLASRRA